ncbi:MAG: NADH-quinone oxidoreductase subunit N, partial [Bacteroidaceae bacterium]|nr:NADH-quinone oxidoreductase subunit N [Bacteroidaceae bacterium]
AFGSGFHILVFIALLNTVISLYYYLLIVKAMYMKESNNALPSIKSDPYTRASLMICVAGIILIGICSFIYTGIESFSFGL